MRVSKNLIPSLQDQSGLKIKITANPLAQSVNFSDLNYAVQIT